MITHLDVYFNQIFDCILQIVFYIQLEVKISVYKEPLKMIKWLKPKHI